MDEGTAELVRLLYTRIGIIMEGASVVALELGGPGSDFRVQAVADLAKASKSITCLLDVAKMLSE